MRQPDSLAAIEASLVNVPREAFASMADLINHVHRVAGRIRRLRQEEAERPVHTPPPVRLSRPPRRIRRSEVFLRKGRSVPVEFL